RATIRPAAAFHVLIDLVCETVVRLMATAAATKHIAVGPICGFFPLIHFATTVAGGSQTCLRGRIRVAFWCCFGCCGIQWRVLNVGIGIVLGLYRARLIFLALLLLGRVSHKTLLEPANMR